MAAWCLPRNLSNAFLQAIQDGRLAPEKLMEMTSEERRDAFAEILGHENAREVNAQFESKLLLKDQKRGLVTWAKKLGGLSEPARRDIIDKINKLDRILNPAEETAFMEDLAAKRLGVSVTSQEAREIFQLAQKADAIKERIISEHGSYAQGTDAEWTVWGRAKLDLIDKINSLKPNNTTIQNKLLNVLSLKPMLTSVLHWSAPFVQGWGMISTRQWWQGLGKMFQYFGDEEAYRDLDAWIVGHPDYQIARTARLGLTKLGDKLTEREEGIQSTLLEQGNEWLSQRTGVPNLIRGWSRSFTGFLNYVRFSRYVDMLNGARLQGLDVSEGSKLAEDLATVVGNFTGRGRLGAGDKYAQVAPVLNAIFFAPRKVVATVEMFNPVAYAKLSPFARQQAARNLIGSLLVTGAVLSLAKAMGAQVSADPRSQDFAKFNIHGEKFDMTGGNATYVRLLGRLISGTDITSAGNKIKLGDEGANGKTRASILVDYARGKLAPIAALIADALYGKDPAGQAFNVTDQLREELTPIVINSYLDFWATNPDDTAAMIPALSALLGVGLESPLPPMSHNGHDVWGNAVPHLMGMPFLPRERTASWRNDPVNQEAERLGVYLGFPRDKIHGVHLTQDQFDQYSVVAGRIAHARLRDVINQPGWENLPAGARAKTMKHIIQTARRSAAQGVMVASQGSKNDIVQKSYEAKLASVGEEP